MSTTSITKNTPSQNLLDLDCIFFHLDYYKEIIKAEKRTITTILFFYPSKHVFNVNGIQKHKPN